MVLGHNEEWRADTSHGAGEAPYTTRSKAYFVEGSSMTAPRARRGRTYASGRYPWAFRTWAEYLDDGPIDFLSATNPHHPRDMRMISRRRML